MRTRTLPPLRLGRLLPGLLGLAALACGGRPDPDLPEPIPVGAPLPIAALWSLPDDWATMPPYEFAALVEAALPVEAITPLGASDYTVLADALGAMDGSSVRAAVILGRSRSDRAGDILQRRIGQRHVGPERASDSGDVVAAAALARFPEPERYWRLLRLVEGDAPHPDFEVRVECACTALSIGFDRVIPFLLKVLRIDTWEGLDDELDFEPPRTSSWARHRAAQALSVRAGVPLTYRADGPIAHREEEARALEERLAEIAANASLVDPRLMMKRW